MTFEVNATHGDIMQPIVMTMSILGIDEISNRTNLYPNPVNDKLYIVTEAEIKEIVVYDVYGRLQVTKTPSHQDDATIDVSSLNSGIYFVEIYTDNGNFIKRIIKQ